MSVEMDLFLDIEGLTRQLDQFRRRQVPFATALAMTRLGGIAKGEVEEEMQRVFDRPTRYTMNSLFLRPARKRDVNPKAVVWFRDWSPKGTAATKYLTPEVHGGERNTKRSESLLRRRGLLGSEEFLVPSRTAKLDRYGNISRGQVVKMLSNVRAQFDTSQNTTNSRKTQYFVGRPGGKAKGVWMRRGRKVQPFMMITRQPKYRRRLDFHGVSERSIRRHYNKEFGKALAYAIATANRG
ncbi:hypothetical protein [Endozoicomonas sp. ALE010]|uniref:hypothetical protein n=1 Tax=Endozoicomonas sp. ALE010 TaxID=3403081 RepID=UPI003BB56F15